MSDRTPFQKLKNSLVQDGLFKTMSRMHSMFVDHAFDLRHGINTARVSQLESLTIESENKKRGYGYQATREKPLKQLLEKIAPMIPQDSVFVDFGCGKGKVLLIVSNYNFREVRGVEFAPELCTIARCNCDHYNNKKTIRKKIKIIESDAADYKINNDENVFFLFNPFDEIVLARVIDNIITSLKIHPRKVLFIYNNPRHGNIIERQETFVKSGEYLLSGTRFTLYSST